MKNLFSIFLLFFILVVFSCKGTPKPQDESPDFSEFTEEELLEDEAEEDSELQPEDLTTEDETSEDNIEEEMLSAEEQFEGEVAGDLSEDEFGESGENDLAEAQLPEYDASAEETEQVAEVLVNDEPEPAAEQTPPPRAPPLPPPALLGPAEERPSVSAHREPPQREQPRRDQSQVEQPQGEPSQSEQPQREQPRSSALQGETFREPPVVSAVRDTPLPILSGIAPQQSDEIIYSRVVRATVGQIVEIPFRGTGWVFLGELASRRGIVYDSRRLDSDGQTFIFRTEEAGTYSLKFFKQDFLRDYILNDYVQVIVGDAPAAAGSGWFNPPFDRGRVTAEPRWPSALEEAEIQRRSASGARPSSGASPVFSPSASESPVPEVPAPVRETAPAPAVSAPPNSSANEPPSSAAGSLQSIAAPGSVQPDSEAVSEAVERLPPEEILKKARESYDEGNVAAAIAMLDSFREYYPSGSDELYWLYGQFYEANTASRDILLALDYYRRLVNEYPQSSRFNDARRRIAYLERFYINIQ